MKKLDSLCSAIGVEPKTFYLETDGPKWYLRSDFSTMREISSAAPNNEKLLLSEAVEMFRNMVDQLTREMEMIKRFKESFYGKNPDDKGYY